MAFARDRLVLLIALQSLISLDILVTCQISLLSVVGIEVFRSEGSVHF